MNGRAKHLETPNMPQAFFPPLDKCLAGQQRLISWKSAYRILCDPEKAVDQGALEAFLTDAESVKYLTSALSPFLPPSQKSKGEFETKTAPINVAQSTNGDYNLEELKKDALWLSDQLKVDELVALRLVILEWQSRAEDSLQKDDGGKADTLVPASSRLGASLFASTMRSTVPSSDPGAEETRHTREMRLYLEEKSYLLQTSTLLVERFGVRNRDAKTGTTWLDSLSEKVAQEHSSVQSAADNSIFFTACIEAVNGLVEELSDASRWPQSFQQDDDLQLLFGTSTVRNLVTTLRLLLARLHVLDGVLSHTAVSSWFKLMGRVNFFQDLAPSAAAPDPSSLQCLVSAISLAILRLPQTLNSIQESAQRHSGGVQYPDLPNDAYFGNDACLQEINIILYRAAHENVIIASPAIFAWSIITGLIRDVAKLQQGRREQHRIDDGSDDGEPISTRRASRRDSKDDLSPFEKQYHLLQDFDMETEARDDPPAFFARSAVDRMNVYAFVSQLCTAISAMYSSDLDGAVSFAARYALLDMIREGMALVPYGTEVLEATLTILRPDVPCRSIRLDYRLADRFLADSEILCPLILDQTLARYPYELTPMLKLLSALSSAGFGQTETLPITASVLEGLQTLTLMFPEHFRSYALDHEDENSNSMLLTDIIPLFATRKALSLTGTQYVGRRLLPFGSESTDGHNVLAIPAGSPGVILKESRPLIIRIEHPHSGLEYLGLLLSTLLPNSELLVPPMGRALDRSTAADIIALITALLKACLRQDAGFDDAKLVLGRLAFALRNEQDIITIIADSMETELLAHLDQSPQESSLDLLIACADFFDTLISVSPERVWSALARSSLLGINGGANALAAVVGASEVTVGRFRFLNACVSIYSHLITDAVTGLVKRNAPITKVTNRFDSPVSFQDATPERTMSTVLNAYQTVMTDAWQNLGEWRFAVLAEKIEISTCILRAFDLLLKTTFGLESGDEGISSLLCQSATTLFDTFTSGSATMQPFLSVFTEGLLLSDENLPTQHRQLLENHVSSAAQLLTTLLRATRTVDATEAGFLASQLLGAIPALAILSTIGNGLKVFLYDLLTEIVKAINVKDTDPPSILAELSTNQAKSFLAVVAQLDGPVRDIEAESAIWNFLSVVLGSKQQWFALYLLTGTLPKDRLKDSKCGTTTKNRSLLNHALDQLSSIATLEPERAIAMLKFVASAQYTWVWATNEARSHSDFLKNALEWLNNLQIPAKSLNTAEEMMLAHEHQMAAYLCDILAVNLYASSEVGDKTLIKMLPGKLSFLTRHGVAVNAYKRSLHKNLAENFARKFPGCDVEDLERSLVNPAPLGRKYLYDLDLADLVFDHEVAWHGSSRSRQQGFSDEFARANVNLSLVEAQTRLLRSWRALATTLCDGVEQDEALQSELAKTAEACLRMNAEANLEQPGMDKVVETRAELAFVITSKLVGVKSSVAGMKALLPSAWALVRSSPVDYEVATDPQDLVYYRTLLRTLYLAIQPHVYGAPARPSSATQETKIDLLDPTVSACLVQIFAKVIAPGFRALCGNLHNDVGLAEPGDFALLTALVQGILSVPGASAVHPQLAEIVASTSITRGALSLYSWSDRLAEVTGQEPVYGEVAILFLLSLSTIRSVAEQIALEGALLQLSAANVSDYLRKPKGKGPFSEPRSIFTIWAEGLLPLCLNLLDAVGPPVAADVAAFLNSFPQQLQRANTALENRQPSRQDPFAGVITLGLISEAHSLCFIARILAADIARGAAEGIDSADVPMLEYDYEKVKEDAAGLLRQKTSLAARVVPVGVREEAWGTNELGEKIDAEIHGLLRCFGEKEGET
ncbi:nucleoporin subcomplex protein binding to Pom34-domain-containing protein [Neohortaea acidophila]|uniref:Nucleoporin NUP188 n=1 Tax=Neohortaea acidophila TaxID=245834 RepID=A0A6A6PVJ8_9PEZI|nr:nucleoporin subcomplex protein binding to Pom34-domain-containing protein [Neohortaea acidophila]KAF2483995.1 nucleoporin subcomplex protein binding to Pom34-domain-containing protein [Neohortaea acidophila]